MPRKWHPRRAQLTRNSNLRTHLLRNLKLAAVQPWPKLFHNMRASRQTELSERFPAHGVCQWMGNSGAVAKKHYMQVTDAHYARAIEESTRGAECGAADCRTRLHRLARNAKSPGKQGHSAA